MKPRLTPLNIVTSAALVVLILTFIQENEMKAFGGHAFNTLFRIILGGIILVSLITDLIFRFLFKSLKRIWFVELIFISLTIILFLLLQK